MENFKFEVIQKLECSEEEIRELEYNYIVQFNCVVPNGYNQTYDTKHPINDFLTYKKIKETKREKVKNVVEVIIDNENSIIKIIKEWRSIVDCAEDTGLNEKRLLQYAEENEEVLEEEFFIGLIKIMKLLFQNTQEINIREKKVLLKFNLLIEK